jgi:hypothetical protein
MIGVASPKISRAKALVRFSRSEAAWEAAREEIDLKRSKTGRVANSSVCAAMFSEGESLFPSAVWEKACSTIGQNFVLQRGFSREWLCLLCQSSSCSSSSSERQAKLYFLDGGIDREKTGGG